eukprot:TRINITY_DN12754_c0_g1_i2.p2 TRINITY_DN12754_c0_g1~~TRINITY_DN12754_c0_g1_i2.p2  ORF type:complete len:218 (-),score=-10.70 TRINITY_DN12754_c0_g1_i2:437-1090(-)
MQICGMQNTFELAKFCLGEIWPTRYQNQVHAETGQKLVINMKEQKVEWEKHFTMIKVTQETALGRTSIIFQIFLLFQIQNFRLSIFLQAVLGTGTQKFQIICYFQLFNYNNLQYSKVHYQYLLSIQLYAVIGTYLGKYVFPVLLCPSQVMCSPTNFWRNYFRTQNKFLCRCLKNKFLCRCLKNQIQQLNYCTKAIDQCYQQFYVCLVHILYLYLQNA